VIDHQLTASMLSTPVLPGPQAQWETHVARLQSRLYHSYINKHYIIDDGAGGSADSVTLQCCMIIPH